MYLHPKPEINKKQQQQQQNNFFFFPTNPTKKKKTKQARESNKVAFFPTPQGHFFFFLRPRVGEGGGPLHVWRFADMQGPLGTLL